MTHFNNWARIYLRLVAMLTSAVLAHVWHSAFPWLAVSVALVIFEVALDGVPKGVPRHELHFTISFGAMAVSVLLWNHRTHPWYTSLNPVSDGLLVGVFWKALDLIKIGIPPTKFRAQLVLSLVLMFVLGLVVCTLMSPDFCPPLMKTYQPPPPPPPPNVTMDGPAFWVKFMRGNATIATTNIAPTIREKRLSPTIDGLKDAVWHYLAEKEQTTVKVSSMSVFQSDGTTSAESDKDDPPLLKNDKSTAYVVHVGE